MPSIGNIHIYTENPWLIVGTESNVLKSRPAGYVIGFATDTRKFFVFDIHEGWASPKTAVAGHKILSEEHEDTKVVDPLEEGQLLVVQKDQDDQDKLKWTALPRGQEGQVLTSTSTSVEWSDIQPPKHNLLDRDTHDDTNTTVVQRGMLITGQDFDGDTKWSGLSLGESGTFLKSNGTDAIWSVIDWDDVVNKPSSFPVTVRYNSSFDVGARPRLNFIEGTNVTLEISDDAVDNEIDITINAESNLTTHNLLQSDVHTDTNTTSVSRGAVIVGQDFTGTILWDALVPTSSNTYLKYTGLDTVWDFIYWDDIYDKPSEFPVNIYKNDSLVGTRPGINFIEGPGISITASDSGSSVDITIESLAGQHQLLSTTHDDTETTVVSRGMIITGQNVGGIIKWAGLPLGTSAQVLKSDGTDVIWGTVDWSEIVNKPSRFPITVRRNSGTDIGTRPRLNFIEGSNITLNITDDTTDNEIDITISSSGGTSTHNLLQSSVHTDTNTTTVARGMVITGQIISGVPKWSGLSLGSSGTVLKSNGVDAVWGNVAWGEITGRPSEFPVSTYRNGTLVGTRPRLNFIEGTGISISASDNSTNNRVNITVTASHPLLSSAHTDTNPTSVQRGMLITVQDISGVNRWSGLSLGASGQVVKSNGTDVIWGAVDWSEVANKPSSFPITVRKNSGANVGTRPRLNFIEGSNITLTVSDDAANNEVAITIAASSGVSTHNLLQSSVHTDTNTASVSRGAVIVGKNFSGINKWDALTPVTANTFLKYDGVDAVWASVSWGDISGKPTEFPVSIYRNSGLVGTRPRINFIEGSGVSISASDDSANNRVNLTFATAGHTLLGSTHSDTNATTVARGMLIVGQDIGGGVIRWSGLPLGSVSSVLKSNGTDVVWSSLDWSEISGKPSSFPVTVQRNGGLIGNRPTLNFIEGTGVSITASDDSANNRINLTFQSGSHQLLSSIHNDTNPTTVTRGMIITGQNIDGIIKWSGLSIGTSGQVVKSNGTDVVWENVDWSEITNKPSKFPISVQENGTLVGTQDTLNFRDGSQVNSSVDFTISNDTTLNRIVIDSRLVGDIGTPTNADRWKLYGTNRGNPPSKGWYTRPWRHIGTRRYNTARDGASADTNEYKPEDVALSATFNVTATGTPPSSVGQILDAGGSNPIFQCVLDVPGLWIVRLSFQHLGRISTTSAGTGNRMECLLQMMKREGTTESTVPESPAVVRTNWVQFFSSGNMPVASYGQNTLLLPIMVTHTGTSTDIRGNSVTGTVVFFKVSSSIVGSTSRLLDQYLSTTTLNAYLVNPNS